jgi:hypothetical protein
MCKRRGGVGVGVVNGFLVSPALFLVEQKSLAVISQFISNMLGFQLFAPSLSFITSLSVINLKTSVCPRCIRSFLKKKTF